MSRRKQSNPKPLKFEEAAAEDGKGGPEGNFDLRLPIKKEKDDDEGISIKEEPANTPSPPSDEKNSRSRRGSGSPERPPSELNGSPLSFPQHLLQAGLPYFHLLPQNIRNDAARFFLSPTMVGAELCPAPAGTPSSNKSEKSESGRSAQLFMCEPCNIKFSSARTLEAHQTYYCSFRKDSGKEASEKGENDEKPEGSTKGSKRESVDDRPEDSPENLSGKHGKTGKLYACIYCSYSADKKVSLNRHMRMHSGPPVTPSTGSGNDEESQASVKSGGVEVNALDRYCQDCDIQFTNIKTFRVHKQYYCSTRHVLKAQQVSQLSTTTTKENNSSKSPSPQVSPQQPFLVLPTNPVIIVPYCFIQGAQILPGNVLPSQNAIVVLPNGVVQALPSTPLQPLLSPHPDPSSPPSSHVFNDPKDTIRRIHPRSSDEEEEMMTKVKMEFENSESEFPAIDLTIRSGSLGPEEDEKENRVGRESPISERHSSNGSGKRISRPSSTSISSVCSSPPNSNLVISMTPEREPSKLNGILRGKGKDVKGGKLSPIATQLPGGAILTSAGGQSLAELLMSNPPELNESLAKLNPQILMNSRSPSATAALMSALSPEIVMRFLDPNYLASLQHSISQATPAQAPQVSGTKRGVSKCVECDIVFYKYENYLVHKEHYCAARGGPPSDKAPPPPSPVLSIKSEASERSESASPVNKKRKSPEKAAEKPALLSPVEKEGRACGKCGVKFASLDNLQTHQSFYCTKNKNENHKMVGGKKDKTFLKCGKCKVSVGEEDMASHAAACSGGTGWKCPCCDIFSPSVSAAQKHLESHTGIRAFKCVLCGYRGNTLRGMRTHIRMHFDKKVCDLQEGDYIACITASDLEPMLEDKKQPSSPDDDQPSTDPLLLMSPGSGKSEGKLHFCNLCNYSSSYKGNVVRHMKLVHKISEEVADEFLLLNPQENGTEGNSSDNSNGSGKEKLNKDKITTNGKNSEDELEIKYCKFCKISFNFTDSFLAHKKFYCNAASQISTDSNNSPPKRAETPVQ